MKQLLTLFLIAALAVPVLGESAQDLFAQSQKFDKAVLEAETLETVFPYLTGNTVDRLKAMDQAGQDKVLMFLQLGIEMAPEDVKVLDSKIGEDEAALRVGIEEDDLSVSREVELRKEDGEWKINLNGMLNKLNK